LKGGRMKVKTIKTILRQKVDDWLETIDNKNLQRDLKEDCIVTGGAIASMLLNEDINDFDIYFNNKDTARRVAEYYVDKFQQKYKVDIKVVEEDDRVKIVVPSDGIAFSADSEMLDEADAFQNILDKLRQHEAKKMQKCGYYPLFFSSNAITLSDDIQLVVRFYGSPEEIHRNYDFVHCTNYWVSDTNELVLRPEAMKSLLTKELVYVGSKYPLASLIRTRKFIRRGFTCNAGQYLKMCWQVSKLNLNDINVLEDQLVGVDAAYFQVLISALRAEKEKSDNFEYDYLYIANLVDKIF